MKRFKPVLAVTVLLMGVGGVGCAKGKGSIHTQKRGEAPRGPEDVGVLVDGARVDQVETLLGKYPNAQVRVLDANRGFYEIFGVTVAETQGLLPEADVNLNEYIRFKPWSAPVPAGSVLPGLKPCRVGANPPQTVLNVSSPAGLKNGMIVERGFELRADGKASRSQSSEDQTLKTVMMVLGPASSAFREKVLTEDSVDFKPDSLGIYQIVAVTQDVNGLCSMDAIRFLVTANPEYDANAAKELKLDVKKFRHLAAISAEKSWAVSEGAGATIAILDTGVNYTHPLLAGAIALNQNEIPDNDIDDDGNGVKDDVIGLDLVAGDVYPYDDDAHGSHVAGLAAGRGFGVARKASVIPVKVMTSLGGDTGSIAAGIVYAVDRGARIINLSLGAQAALPHPAMVKAAAYAEAHDAVLVVAAGNGDPSTGLGFSIDTKSVFPASLQNDNLITVAASSGGKLAPYSNFGARDVDVVAPGGKTPDDVMISAAYDNPEGALFIGMNGTSMATPVVSGVLALLLDVNPNLTGKELKNAVLAAGPRSPELSSVTVSGRLLDAYEALTLSRQSAASF